MLTIDGSQGEGGGQILRTALALSLVTGQEFRIDNIRAGREKSGLLRQHLTAVEAAARIGNAHVEGAALGSQRLTFCPAGVQAGEYQFLVGTAGSTTLVLQTVLPALALAAGPSALVLEGGTHNPFAPPFEFLAKSYLPLLNTMGPKIRAKLDRSGFYPAGGGKIRVTVEPAPRFEPLELLERGNVLRTQAVAVVANLPSQIAEREIRVLKRKLDLDEARVEQVRAQGPGNIVTVEIKSAHVTEVVTSFGAPGIRSEQVADEAFRQTRAYLAAGVPVGEHLADQLLLPLALAGGGSFRTMPLTAHTTTNLEIIRQFVGLEVRVEQVGDQAWQVRMARPH